MSGRYDPLVLRWFIPGRKQQKTQCLQSRTCCNQVKIRRAIRSEKPSRGLGHTIKVRAFDCYIRFTHESHTFSTWRAISTISTPMYEKLPVAFNGVSTKWHELSMRCSRRNVANSNKPFIDLINQGRVLNMTSPKERPTFFSGHNLWLRPSVFRSVSATIGLWKTSTLL